MTDPLAALANKLIVAVLNDASESDIAAILRDAFLSVYLTSSAAGAAAERERALKIVYAVVNNAAGDTTLGQTILKRIREG